MEQMYEGNEIYAKIESTNSIGSGGDQEQGGSAASSLLGELGFRQTWARDFSALILHTLGSISKIRARWETDISLASQNALQPVPELGNLTRTLFCGDDHLIACLAQSINLTGAVYWTAV